uniref:SUN domain-containing protein n=1 Tax=Amphora coffeiformis TaxID=265554 RepID=A0A7S3P4J4_9STRA|mmetsp:Transcript_6254/g.12506  ORF Transcript_6254/g.12506 Transcript_6254/m.12506 type:complete len:838 (-) Transcript_6254:109-2622(-)|eukprot:scaffold10861_cov180-Amphora_coffeaeformis.AAC.36
MPRVKGLRRVCILLASILPLLADEPNTAAAAPGVVHTTENAPIEEGRQQPTDIHQHTDADDDWTTGTAAQRIMEDESLTKLPTLTDWSEDSVVEFGQQQPHHQQHYNHVLVVPYRPRPRGRRGNHTHHHHQSTNSEANDDSFTTEDDVQLSKDEKSDETTSDTLTDVDPPAANISTQTNESEKKIDDTSNATQTSAVDDPASGGSHVPQSAATDSLDEEGVNSVKFDYASKSAGALILEKSAGWKGASNLLNGDNDRYAIIPCADTSKSVVISLSEDILVKHVVLANYERFSSTVKDFQLLGSQTMGKWVDLGTYTAKQGGGKQEFELYEHSWARYLKVRVLSHYGNEHYLTISQISVFGDTMLQGFHEHWEEDQEEEGQEDENRAEEATPESDASEAKEADLGAPCSASIAVDEEGSANPIEISEFTSNNPCPIESSDDICPKDLNFEQLVCLISSNESQFERMSFLATSSACRSMSKYEHVDFPEISVHSMAPATALARESRKSTDATHALSTKEDFGVTVNTEDSPVISQIQNLIKSAAGIDVDLSKVNNLFQGHEDEESASKEETKSVPVPVEQHKSESTDTSAKQNVEVMGAPPKEGSPISRESKDAGKSAKIDAEQWEKLLKALERVPSSSCLKEIDFGEFRKRVASNKNGAAGPGNGHSPGASVELQPIFKRLTDELKTLQGTLGIQEEFLKSTVSCYQRVLLDLVVHQEETQSHTEKRLEDLERAINTYLMWLCFVEDCIAGVTAFLVSVFTKPWYSWFSKQLERVPDTVLLILVAITTLVSCRMVISSGWRWLRSRNSSRVSKGYKKAVQEQEGEKFYDTPEMTPEMK